MRRFLFRSLPAWLLLVVFGLIVVHAPLSVWLGTQVPGAALAVKAWKEVLILLAALLVAGGLYQSGAWRSFVRRPVVALALIYCALHVFMIGLYPQGVLPTIAGLMIDTRYVLYFVAVYGLLVQYPAYKPVFVRTALAGAVVVLGFAVLQLFLPKDFLTVLGYGPGTIEPFITVDENPDFVRYSSTLRGPNPLGAYAAMVLAGVVAYGVHYGRRVRDARIKLLHAGLALAGAVALWISYSRSAWLAAGAAIAAVVGSRYGRRVSQKTWATGLVLIVVLLTTVFAIKDTAFFQNVVLHNNPATGATVDSNTAHVDSLADGLARMAVQPLGAGIGSTGSASLLGSNGTIIENQYLMIAHEVGWLGIILFLILYGALLRQLWIRRDNWLAAALFASGVGLAVIGILLPVWADDTVGIIWWGLAALALTGGMYGKHSANKKTKRTA